MGNMREVRVDSIDVSGTGVILNLCADVKVDTLYVPTDLIKGDCSSICDYSRYDRNRDVYLIEFWNVDGVFRHPYKFWDKQKIIGVNRIIEKNIGWFAEKVDEIT